MLRVIEPNEKVMEITRLAMEINELGKHQVFVSISPHVKDLSVSVIEGNWERGKKNLYSDYFYWDKLDSSNFDFMKTRLLEIKEKDLSGVESFKVKENNNQFNCNTNANKVKQVRLISQQDYEDLIKFLDGIETEALNCNFGSVVEAVNFLKNNLKEKIGEMNNEGI